MSCCNSITGITFSCLSNTGGVKEIYIACFDSLVSATVSSGEIIFATVSAPFEQFQFNKNTSSITEEATINLENGTTFYTQTVTLVIPRREVSKRNAILLLADGQPNLHIIVKDQNDEYWWVGYENGANLTANVTGSGTTKTELNGYTLTFTAEEPSLALGIDPAVIPTII